MKKIPVSVLVMTRNEERNLAGCLSTLENFDEIIVVDSNSTDKTKEIAQSFGATVVNFTWNGQYPKKRQWCLDNLELKNDWVFFVDADEHVTPKLLDELGVLFSLKDEHFYAGFFVRGRYMFEGKALRFGLKNNKLCLFNRHIFRFPEINDLDIEGMGEIEGHYQPVLTSKGKVGQFDAELLHYAHDDADKWDERHKRYARWEAGMIKRGAFPDEPTGLRQTMKAIFRKLPARDLAAFCYSFIFKGGFLDGKPGWDFALSRAKYYRMVRDQLELAEAEA